MISTLEICKFVFLFFELVLLRLAHFLLSLQAAFTHREKLNILNQFLNQILQVHKQTVQLVPPKIAHEPAVLNRKGLPAAMLDEMIGGMEKSQVTGIESGNIRITVLLPSSRHEPHHLLVSRW